MVRLMLKAALLCSITFVLMNGACVQAQSTTSPPLKDFPIGLALEYDLHHWTWDGSETKSHISYEVTGWLIDQEIVEIRYSGGWDVTALSGVQFVNLVNWSIVDANGTETGGFMNPLWMSIAVLVSRDVKIPTGNPPSPLYCQVTPVRNGPEGAVTSWECKTDWYEGGGEWQKLLYYESVLGVLVVTSEIWFPSSSGVIDGNQLSDFESVFTKGNIQSFISPQTVSEAPISPALTMIPWFLLSVSVIAVPVVVILRSKS